MPVQSCTCNARLKADRGPYQAPEGRGVHACAQDLGLICTAERRRCRKPPLRWHAPMWTSAHSGSGSCIDGAVTRGGTLQTSSNSLLLSHQPGSSLYAAQCKNATSCIAQLTGRAAAVVSQQQLFATGSKGASLAAGQRLDGNYSMSSLRMRLLSLVASVPICRLMTCTAGILSSTAKGPTIAPLPLYPQPSRPMLPERRLRVEKRP